MRWCWVNFQCRGVLPILITVGQVPIALAVGAGGDGLDIFILIYPFSSLPLYGRRSEIYFSAFTGIVDLLYLSISVFIINLYQFLILYSSKSTVVVKLFFSNAKNIYLISLVFSESGRLSFANGIDATHIRELEIRRVLH